MRLAIPSPPVRKQSFALAILLLLITGTVPLASAQGLAVSPTRAVFEGRTRTMELTLLNRGTSPETYRIFFKQARMTEEGGLADLERPEPGGMYVDRLIRYAPRQITIPANGAQTVRLVVRKPRSLPAGEYRSHLVFQSVPSRDTGQNVEVPDLQRGEIFIKMIQVFAISIPVIVRHGELAAKADLADLELGPGEKPEDPPQLKLRLHRDGNRSLYGDITVTFTPPGGEPIQIGLSRGVAVYTSVSTRKVSIPIQSPEDVTLQGGLLEVFYRERLKDRSSGPVIAKGELALQ